MRPTAKDGIAAIEVALVRLDTKLDMILRTQNDLLRLLGPRNIEPRDLDPAPTSAATPPPPDSTEATKFFRQFTPKQNAVLQMLLRGAQNDIVATRLGVALNTAKVHVRLIARKLGVTTRAQIALKALPFFNAIDARSYEMMTQGLPKDWHENFQEPDKYRSVYANDAEAD